MANIYFFALLSFFNILKELSDYKKIKLYSSQKCFECYILNIIFLQTLSRSKSETGKQKNDSF